MFNLARRPITPRNPLQAPYSFPVHLPKIRINNYTTNRNLTLILPIIDELGNRNAQFSEVLLAVLIGVAISLSNLTPALAASTAPVVTLNEFVAALPAGSANQVAGVYASGVFALPVVQQPAGDAGFVSSQPEVLTQFAMASSYGTTGSAGP